MARKRGSVWTEPSRYGTYDGERGNPDQWKSGFNFSWENSDTVKVLLGNSAYAALGLQPSASEEEVKKAYRKLVRVHHPDKGGNPAKFQEIATAYQTIISKQMPLFDDDPPTPRTPRKKREAPSDDPHAESLIIPQLLTPIDESELEAYLNDDNFACQEKKDGKHITLQVLNNQFFVRNKKGIVSTCSPEFESALRSIHHNILIDGEQIGDKFWTWDILELDNDLRSLPYASRFEILNQLNFASPIHILPLAVGTAKRQLFNELKANGKEGIVFKRLAALFTSGKGFDQFKFKFYHEASFIVCPGRPGKMSIGLELIGNAGPEFMGYCTCNLIPLPVPGTIVEVKYLYAYRGGRIYQPAFKEIRDDVDADECLMSQLKYKAEED